MATYAIGDVQGCFDALQKLLKCFSFNPEKDRLWFAGDLVNRGAQSLETLRFVQDLGDSAITILGNHDLYLLMVHINPEAPRASDDTLQSVLDAPDAEQLLNWVRTWPLCYQEGEYCMVHAGLLPQWSVQQALSLGQEVESALQGAQCEDFMRWVWGSEPAIWDDTLSSWARLRVIVNGMTRLRFCALDGTIDLTHKGPPGTGPAGYVPWFDVPSRKSQDHVLIHGHWSALRLQNRPNLLSLDTGCLYGGKLTAIRLEDRQVFQVAS